MSLTTYSNIRRGWHGCLLVAALALGFMAPCASAEPVRIVSVSDVPRDSGSGTGADVFLNHLENSYVVSLSHVNMGDPQPDLKALDDCDVILFHPQGPIADGRRDRLRVYLESETPLVALRGATAAFGDGSGFDIKVLGARFSGQYDSVKRLIANALFCAAGLEPQRTRLPDLVRWERKQGDLTVPLRSRKQAGGEGGNAWSESVTPVTLPVDVSAIVVADMRDAHWCASATAQVDAMAQKVNQLVSTAREAGMLIVHVPSETSGFYDYHPARRRVEQIAALTVEGDYPVEPLETRESVLPPMPIANADCPGGGTSHTAWTRQHPAIAIHDTDILSGDGRQLYSYLLSNGIDTLFYVGIHANTTLIERSYGMRQMSAWGMDCVLVRDLTDIMFDPEGAPQMTHDLALQKVIEHLEKHLLPTVTSQQFAAALAEIEP